MPDIQDKSMDIRGKSEREGYHRMPKTTIIKNLLIVSIAFFFLFTAFQSLQNLQSSLNKEEGLGTVSLSVIYVFGIVAGIFLPPLVINRIGCKWTVAASMICYTVFIAANLHAVWGTMIPASVIIGNYLTHTINAHNFSPIFLYNYTCVNYM